MPLPAGLLRRSSTGSLSIPITGITFDAVSLNQFDNGSDLWPTCIDGNGRIFTAGGDGNGWDGVDTRGLDTNDLGTTLVPTGNLSVGTEKNSKVDVLPQGLLAIGTTLYRLEEKRGSVNGSIAGEYNEGRIGRSTDGGTTWTYLVNGTTGWTFSDTSKGLGHGRQWVRGTPGFASFYDNYVYLCSDAVLQPSLATDHKVYLGRCLSSADLRDSANWQWYTGTGPTWGAISSAAAVFTEPGSDMHWGPIISWNSVLNRFLLTYTLASAAGTVVVCEAPAPWGPWTEIHRAQLIDADEKFCIGFVNKQPDWLSSDGLTWWATLSGVTNTRTWDAFTVIKATLTTAPPQITSVAWDCPSLITSASDSDIWPVTWADDDKQYTAYGDGEGFSLGTRVAYGLASITGSDPNTATYTDLLRGDPNNGKIGGLLSLGGVLYVLMMEQNGGHNHSLRKSTDHGVSITAPIWTVTTDPFPQIFVQQGKDHGSAIDGFVYATGSDWLTPSPVYLFRVPIAQIETLASWEVFSGTAGAPTWSSNFANKAPIFSDAGATSINGAGHCVVTYFPPISQFVLTFHAVDDMGSFTIASGPKPWGPWTTIATYTNWCSNGGALTEMLMRYPAPKWISNVSGNTLDFWITFSATGIWDRFNARRGTFTLG